MIRLKPVTEKSWIVLTDSLDRIGILSEQPRELVLLINDSKSKFNTREDLNTFFGEDVFSKIIEVEADEPKIEHYVKGYGADTDRIFVPKEEHELPLYAKTESSEIYYAAGHYCINFPKGWLPAFCPKLTTLTKYGYKGPYKTESDNKLIHVKLRRGQSV